MLALICWLMVAVSPSCHAFPAFGSGGKGKVRTFSPTGKDGHAIRLRTGGLLPAADHPFDRAEGGSDDPSVVFSMTSRSKFSAS